MSYTTISELPELIQTDIDGSEYLLITNADNVSNKILLSTIEAIFKNSMEDPINLKINEINTKIEALNTSQSITELITTEKTLIQNNELNLTRISLGDIVHNIALIFDEDSNIFYEYSCSINSDGTKVIFDPNDELNNKYGVVTYLASKNS